MSETKKGLYERELEHLAANRKMLEKNRERCQIVDDLEREFPDLFVSGSVSCSVSCAFNLGAVSDIVPVLRRISRVHGLCHKGVVKSSSGLSWTFRDKQGQVGLHVLAFFKSDGQCKQVQVGEKLVPVYEIRCGATMDKVEDLVDELEKEEV